MHREMVRIERRKLYEEIWATPIHRVAKRYGVSDVGLAKICLRFDIPVPARGYWRKKEIGEPVLPEPLPSSEDPLKDVVVFYRVVRSTYEDDVQKLLAFENPPKDRILVKELLSEPHPLVTKIQKELAQCKEDKFGILTVDTSRGVVVKVGRDSIDRALRILNALLKALVSRGFASADDDGTSETTLTIFAEKVTFEIEDSLDRKEHELTPAEQKEKLRRPWMYSQPQYDYTPSGNLVLRITNPTSDVDRLTWADGRKQRLEKVLNSFVAGLIRAAAAGRKLRVWRENFERERAEEDRKRRQRDQLKRIEERSLWALFSEAAYWQKSQQIRAYVRAVKARAEKDLCDITPGSSLDKWMAWALKRADRLDPLAPLSYCTQQDRRDDPSPYHADTKPVTEFDLTWQRLLRRSDYWYQSSSPWASRHPWDTYSGNSRFWQGKVVA